MTTFLSPPPDYQVPRLPVRRFTVDEYHQMIATGVLGEGEKVELLRGWIVPKMSRNPPHDVVLGLTDEALRVRLPADWKIRVHSAITTTDSEPEPDIAVVRGPLTRYVRHHPHSGDIGMLVEVADSSLDTDRSEKGPIYAAANVPYYWLVNVQRQIVEVYSEPLEGQYRSYAEFAKGEEIPLILDGQRIAVLPVAELFLGL
jgi:Uma2 family endonuclease